MGSLPQLNTDPLDIGSSFARGAQLRQMERQNRLADLAMQRREAEYQREEQARQYLPGALQGDQSKLEQLMQTSPEMGMQVSQYRDAQQQKKIQLSQQQTERAAQAIWYIRQAPDDKKQRLWEDFRDNALPSMAPEAYRLLQGQPWDDDTALAWMAANVPHDMLKQLVKPTEEYGEAKPYFDSTGQPIIGQVSKSGDLRVIPGLSPHSDKMMDVQDKDSPTGFSSVPVTGKKISGVISDKQKVEKDESFDREKKLREEFQKESKNFVTIRDAYSRMQANKEVDSPYGSMSLIYGVMKLFDPESVVRETEYATAENARGVPENIRAVWNKVISGERLTPEQKTQILQVADNIYASQQSNFKRNFDQYNRLAEAYKLDPQKVTGMGGDYLSLPNGQTQRPTPGGIRKPMPGAGGADLSGMSDDELMRKAREMGAL